MLEEAFDNLVVVVTYCLDLCRERTEFDDKVMESFIVPDYLHGSIQHLVCEELRPGFLSGAFKQREEMGVLFIGKADGDTMDFLVRLARATNFSFPG